MFKELFTEDWYNKLENYLESKEFLELNLKIIKERTTNKIYPSSKSLFKIFKEIPLSNVEVVILGQNPHSKDDGLAFSNKLSPTLESILKEVNRDIYKNEQKKFNIDLHRWVKQGVFLMNTSRTSSKGHSKYWKKFNKEVINSLNTKDNIIWLLWGSSAKNYKKYIKNNTHLIIESEHPVNKTNPFNGCGCFSKCNNHLKQLNKEEIKW